MINVMHITVCCKNLAVKLSNMNQLHPFEIEQNNLNTLQMVPPPQDYYYNITAYMRACK